MSAPDNNVPNDKGGTSMSAARFAFRRTPIACVIAAGLGYGLCGPALAITWTAGDVNIDLNTRITSGVAIRTQGPDPTYIGIAHGGTAYSNNVDDAERMFKAGDLANATTKLNSALTVSWKQFGIFGRGYYGYDPLSQDKDFVFTGDYGPGKLYGIDQFNQIQKNNRDHLGHPSAILDLYAYANEDLWGHSLSVKVGKQVVNWGESTLVLNGLNSLVSIDASKARIPGAEISDFVIPVPQVFASLNLVESVSVEGFYQWSFKPSLVDSVGSFYPVPDQNFTGLGAMAGDLSFGRAPNNSLAGTDCSATGGNNNLTPGTCVPYGGDLARSADRRPKGGGQYGAALRFSVPQLNDADMAVYAANYHSRLPLFSAISASSGNVSASTGSYFAEYPEDIHMYGFSFNTSLPWGLAFQGEYSYKPNQPINLNAVEVEETVLGAPSQLTPQEGAALGNQYVRGYRRKEVSQLDFGLTKILGGSNWFHWDQLVMIAEIAGDRVHNLESPDVLAYEGPNTWKPVTANESLAYNIPQQQGGYPTPNSWGYKLLFRADYNNVLVGGLTLQPTLRWDHDVRGITPEPLANFVANSRAVTPSLGWKFRSNLTGEFAYATYFGGGQSNLWRDRDNFNMYVRYSF